MKKTALIGAALALCLSLTACDNFGMPGGRNSGNASGSSSVSGSESGSMMEDLSKGASDVGDAIGDGASDMGEAISDGIDSLDPNKNSESSTDSGADSDSDSASGSRPAGTRPAEIDPALLEGLDAAKQGWGQGVDVDPAGRPVGALRYEEKYGKYGAAFIGENEKVFYLTFDEGYENGYTETILDVLSEKNVRAVFFVTYDYCERNPALVRRMLAEGHAVGNHTWSHPSLPTLSPDEAAEEIMKLHRYVEKAFGYKMTLLRPPMGEFSERTLEIARQLGYRSVFWSFAYRDWDPDDQPGEETAYRKITESAHPGEICLLHAVSKDNAAVLGRAIDALRSDGYVFKLL